MAGKSLAQVIMARIRALRENAKITQEQLDELLVIGPGWVARFEDGDVIPSIDMIGTMLNVLGCKFADVVEGLEAEDPTSAIDRDIRAEPDGKNLMVLFRYAKHNAVYKIKNATIDEFSGVLNELRKGLAAGDNELLMSDAVSKAFRQALKFWPGANPSDIWYFVISRAFCDPFNHNARSARKDLSQSWRRTGGWALEKVIVDHYRDELKKHDINIYTGTNEQKASIIAALGLPDRLEADKVDVVLTADTDEGEKFFGVIHVKASFAERRTDDVPMSRILIDTGLTSPLLTMDCKATPGVRPVNRGELGKPRGTLKANGEPAKLSAKRLDIEDDCSFSACFSYNANTIPTPTGQEAAARIHVANFKNANDEFSKFIVEEWERIRGQQEAMQSRAAEKLASGATAD